jgi:hypothetical protein
MPDKRMRPIVKREPSAFGAQELLLEQDSVTRERDRQSRSDGVAQEGAGAELELQLLRANSDAQAFALQMMERERAIQMDLLQAKTQVAELRAEIRIKVALIEEKNVHLLCKDSAIEAKDALIRRLQSETRWWDDVLVIANTAQHSGARAACTSAVATLAPSALTAAAASTEAAPSAATSWTAAAAAAAAIAFHYASSPVLASAAHAAPALTRAAPTPVPAAVFAPPPPDAAPTRAAPDPAAVLAAAAAAAAPIRAAPAPASAPALAPAAVPAVPAAPIIPNNLGRYASLRKHVVSALHPTASNPNLRIQKLATKPPPAVPTFILHQTTTITFTHQTLSHSEHRTWRSLHLTLPRLPLPSRPSATRASSSPVHTFAISMASPGSKMARSLLILMPGLKLLRVIPLISRW